MDKGEFRSLQGRRVLVTGGARGLGETIVRELCRSGAQVVFGDILIDQGNAVANSLRSSGFTATFVPLDLALPESIEVFVEEAAGLLGGVDGLVNNGAVTSSGGKLATELSIETWDNVMNVNVRGTWLMSVAALPYLRASGHGSIVNFSSDTVLWGATKLLAYVASKAAVIAMTKSLAREFGPDGITVNALAPGMTDVEATKYIAAERHDLYRKGRAFSRTQVPDDVVGPCLFLLSDASRFVTGQLLPINGGFQMR